MGSTHFVLGPKVQTALAVESVSAENGGVGAGPGERWDGHGDGHVDADLTGLHFPFEATSGGA